MVFQSASPSNSATALERRRSSWADQGRPVILSLATIGQGAFGTSQTRYDHQIGKLLSCPKLCNYFSAQLKTTCPWSKVIPPMKKTTRLLSTMLSTWLPYPQLQGTGSSPPPPPT